MHTISRRSEEGWETLLCHANSKSKLFLRHILPSSHPKAGGTLTVFPWCYPLWTMSMALNRILWIPLYIQIPNYLHTWLSCLLWKQWELYGFQSIRILQALVCGHLEFIMWLVWLLYTELVQAFFFSWKYFTLYESFSKMSVLDSRNKWCAFYLKKNYF